MSQEISLRRVERANHSTFEGIWDLLEETFPVDERPSRAQWMANAVGCEPFEVYEIHKETSAVGTITVWDLGAFVYVEHFAVRKSSQGGGIGAEVMRQLKRKVERPIVLEIELPTDEQSTRRASFYERLGFEIVAHDYWQPPYMSTVEPLQMYLLAWVESGETCLVEEVVPAIYRSVYRLSEDDFIRFYTPIR